MQECKTEKKKAQIVQIESSHSAAVGGKDLSSSELAHEHWHTTMLHAPSPKWHFCKQPKSCANVILWTSQNISIHPGSHAKARTPNSSIIYLPSNPASHKIC